MVKIALLILVSILSQPEGRELHAIYVFIMRETMFQSSPSPKAGSYKGDEDENCQS